MAGDSPSGEDSNDPEAPTRTRDLNYYLSLSTNRLEQEIRAGGEDVIKFVEDHGLTLSKLAEWIRQLKAGRLGKHKASSSSAPAGDHFNSPDKEGSEKATRTPPESRHRMSLRPRKSVISGHAT